MHQGRADPLHRTNDGKIEEFDRQGYTCNKIDNEFMIYGDTGFCGTSGGGAMVLVVDLCWNISATSPNVKKGEVTIVIMHY